MADSLITDLTLRSSLDGTEELPLNVPGTPDVDRKTTVADVKDYAQADLGSAAFEDTTAFATAAQGGLADSAVQPGDLGTAAYANTGDFATAAQGGKADSALQPSDIGTTAGTVCAGDDSRLSNARTPTAHASSHVDGSDDIQDATASQKGLMTAAYATKLDGIEAGADVTDAVNVGSSINGATAKTTPVDADTMPLIDSADSNALKKVTWANIKATLKTYWDTLYAKIGDVTASGLTMSTARILGRTTASTGAVEELTAAAATAFLSAMVGDSGSGGTKGLAPAPAAGDAAGGKFLKADGTWAVPGGGGGKILQVVQETKTDTASVTGSSFDSVFTASITPSSSSSRVLVMAFLSVGGATSNYPNIRLTKSGSVLLQGDTAGSRTRVTAMGNPGVAGAMNALTINYVDSPASTSALTYEIELASHSTGAVYLNRSGTDTDGATISRATSTIILMEVGA